MDQTTKWILADVLLACAEDEGKINTCIEHYDEPPNETREEIHKHIVESLKAMSAVVANLL